MDSRLLSLILGVVLGFLYLSPGRGHGDAAWIAEGAYTNAAGESCCGENDCHLLPVDAVQTTSSGYSVAMFGEIVPYSEALRSRDGRFWRCSRPDGSRRCFFAPPPST